MPRVKEESMKKKLTQTEKKVVLMLIEGKQVWEIAVEIGKPIPIVTQMIEGLIEVVIQSVDVMVENKQNMKEGLK